MVLAVDEIGIIQEKLAYTISKPIWLCHTDEKNKRKSIFCLDLHPQVPLLATGSIDASIKLWNVTDCKQEIGTMEGETEASSANDTKQSLCVGILSRHSGAILALKWSPNGKYLASGSDDRMVVVWSSNENGAFKAFKILTSHSSDVTDVAWGKDSLITCGIDNMVYVYDSARFNIVSKITLSNLVKGLSIDPLGAFLACQLEDSLVLIRTNDWGIEKTVYKSTQEYSNTFFSRPSWCPDGSLLATSNFSSPSGPSTWLFQRDTWISEVCLVGHQGSIECSRFSPTFYFVSSDGKQKEIVNSNTLESSIGLIAVGSQDGSISIWSNNDSKPFLVIWDLFSHSTLDICWNREGTKFYACSFDGSVVEVAIEFPSSVKIINQENILQLIDLRKSSHVSSSLPESMIELELKSIAVPCEIIDQTSNSKELETNGSKLLNSSALLNRSVSQGLVSGTAKEITQDSLTTLREQRIEKTKDGKKRIVPQFIKPIESFAEESAMPTAIKKSIAIDVNMNIQVLPETTSAVKEQSSSKKYLLSSFKNVQNNAITNISYKGNAGYSVSLQNIPKSTSNRITVQKNDRLVWNENINSKFITCLDYNQTFMVVVTDNSFMSIMSMGSGRRLLPQILLENDIHRITINDNLLLVLFVDGKVVCWNVEEKNLVLASSSIFKYLEHCSIKHISKLSIDSNTKNITISIPDGSKLKYYSDLQGWTVQNAREITNEYSLASLYSKYPESIDHQIALKVLELSPESIIHVSLKELEERMNVCCLLQNYELYKQLCEAYFRLLCSSSSVSETDVANAKVLELFSDLLIIYRRSKLSLASIREIIAVPLHYGKYRQEIEEFLHFVQ